jgi:hypothetical protein
MVVRLANPGKGLQTLVKVYICCKGWKRVVMAGKGWLGLVKVGKD